LSRFKRLDVLSALEGIPPLLTGGVGAGGKSMVAVAEAERRSEPKPTTGKGLERERAKRLLSKCRFGGRR